MFPVSILTEFLLRCLLHACGDVSAFLRYPARLCMFAPRMWRCFWGITVYCKCPGVCSTHVEMFLWKPRSRGNSPRLLHACGDVSQLAASGKKAWTFAPRMWRCFWQRELRQPQRQVCSTHVEMFLVKMTLDESEKGLLHACGDVSSGCKHVQIHSCVCSTHVEMFPISIMRHLLEPCLLHACGDVSPLGTRRDARHTFAPRMWRCFSCSM